MLAVGFCLGLNAASADNCKSDQSSADNLTQIPVQSMPSVGHPEQGAATGQFGVKKFELAGQPDARNDGDVQKEASEDAAASMPESAQADLLGLEGTPYQAGSGYTSLPQDVVALIVLSDDQTASAEDQSAPAISE